MQKPDTDTARNSGDNVKIPYDIFVSLCHYHLLHDATPSETLEIKLYLESKMRKLHNHYSYTPKATRKEPGDDGT